MTIWTWLAMAAPFLVSSAGPRSRRRRSLPTCARAALQAILYRAIPGGLALLVGLAVLLPVSGTAPDHPDERQYVWSAGYYAQLAARLSAEVGDPNSFTDPGWHPLSYWARTQPMGARFVYAVAMAASRTDPPRAPYLFENPEYQGTSTHIPPDTLAATRFAAVLCAALAFGVVAWRFGWIALATLALLALPHAREDLARAWAEGPLLLGLAVAAAAFGTRWFPVACAVAATFKLTALALWPLVFLFSPIGQSRFRHSLGLLFTAALWGLLTPQSWPAFGPAYLLVMGLNRASEHAYQSALFGGPFGLFVPSRYLLPVEFAGALALAVVARRAGAALALWTGLAGTVRRGPVLGLERNGPIAQRQPLVAAREVR